MNFAYRRILRFRPWAAIAFACATAVVFAFALVSDRDARADARLDSGFVSLFNGRDLTGWTRIGGKAEAWGVENGCLISYGEGGGWLATPKDYANFLLRLEFKLSPESNSGVYLRAPADMTRISRTGMEIQLLDDGHPRYKTIKPYQRSGSIYEVAAAEAGHLRPTGEWNVMEIKLEGSKATIRINSAVVVADDLAKHPAELEQAHPGIKRETGRIGLQSHNGRVEFRAIEVKELGAPKS